VRLPRPGPLGLRTRGQGPPVSAP